MIYTQYATYIRNVLSIINVKQVQRNQSIMFWIVADVDKEGRKKSFGGVLE